MAATKSLHGPYAILRFIGQGAKPKALPSGMPRHVRDAYRALKGDRVKFETLRIDAALNGLLSQMQLRARLGQPFSLQALGHFLQTRVLSAERRAALRAQVICIVQDSLRLGRLDHLAGLSMTVRCLWQEPGRDFVSTFPPIDLSKFSGVSADALQTFSRCYQPGRPMHPDFLTQCHPSVRRMIERHCDDAYWSNYKALYDSGDEEKLRWSQNPLRMELGRMLGITAESPVEMRAHLDHLCQNREIALIMSGAHAGLSEWRQDSDSRLNDEDQQLLIQLIEKMAGKMLPALRETAHRRVRALLH